MLSDTDPKDFTAPPPSNDYKVPENLDEDIRLLHILAIEDPKALQHLEIIIEVPLMGKSKNKNEREGAPH